MGLRPKRYPEPNLIIYLRTCLLVKMGETREKGREETRGGSLEGGTQNGVRSTLLSRQ